MSGIEIQLNREKIIVLNLICDGFMYLSSKSVFLEINMDISGFFGHIKVIFMTTGIVMN